MQSKVTVENRGGDFRIAKSAEIIVIGDITNLLCPGANDNASGVALLERPSWREEVCKTLRFVGRNEEPLFPDDNMGSRVYAVKSARVKNSGDAVLKQSAPIQIERKPELSALNFYYPDTETL
jgi:hypothetical protein